MTKIHIDSNGSIYILDGGNGRVTKWKQGDTVGEIVAGGNGIGYNITQLDSSYGMFIDEETSIIWIADTNNHRIVQWLSPTNSVYICGSYGVRSANFQCPRAIFIDKNDPNIFYVVDTCNHRIQMWSLRNLTEGKTIIGQTGVERNDLNHLSYPSGILVDENRTIYIADTGNSRIMRWIFNSTMGEIIAGVSSSGTLSYQLSIPYNLMFDSHGSLIVVDYGNSRVQKFPISCSKF